jgi:hypothetical protein
MLSLCSIVVLPDLTVGDTGPVIYPDAGSCTCPSTGSCTNPNTGHDGTHADTHHHLTDFADIGAR